MAILMDKLTGFLRYLTDSKEEGPDKLQEVSPAPSVEDSPAEKKPPVDSKGTYSTQGYGKTPHQPPRKRSAQTPFTNNPVCQKCGCKMVVQNTGQTMSQGGAYALGYFLLACPKCLTNCMMVGRPLRDPETGESKAGFISFWCDPRQFAEDKFRLSKLASNLKRYEAHLEEKSHLVGLKD